MKGLILNLYLSTKLFINKGQERSVKAKKNIITSGLVKGGSIIIGFLLVPITLNYINPTSYGIWITLSSIIGWFSFFDIGFGHGLRNKFTESVAVNNFKLAKKYVSTTYAILTIIVVVLFTIFLIIHQFLDWSKILNAPQSMRYELNLTALIVFTFFCIKFILSLLNTVFTANQEPAIASIFDFIGSLLSLFAIFVLINITKGNLVFLSFALSVTPVIALLVGSFWFYKGKYEIFSPSFSTIDFKLTSSLVNLGLKFFIIQISAIVVYSTHNIIISHLFGPEEVTTYNISFKLFSILTMVFSIISAPFWSAFTDAYVKEDYIWIQNILNKMQLFWYFSIGLALILLIISPKFINLWVGDVVNVPFSLSFIMALQVISFIWMNIYVTLLNGTGKIKLQFFFSIIISIINIPLAIYMGKFFGIQGIPLSSTLIFTVMGIIFYLQTNKIMNRTAKGIWNK